MKRLNLEQRTEIYAFHKCGYTQTRIAQELGVSVSTICRELHRNSENGKYHYHRAQQKADHRARTSHIHSISVDVWVRVVQLLRKRWSPDQISHWLRNEEGITIGHETIYRYIRADKKAGGNLYTYCRFKLKHRRRNLYRDAGKRFIPNRLDISQRPPEHNPPYFGNFEMDLVMGARNKGAILTIVERSTMFFTAVKLPHGKNAHYVARAVVDALWLFKGAIRSITTDNDLQHIVSELNDRPRKKISYKNGSNICFENFCEFILQWRGESGIVFDTSNI